MVELWRLRWAKAVEQWSDLPALVDAAETISFRRLAAEADHHHRHYEALPGWAVGRCVAWPWRNERQDLPRLLGLWLAGGVWVAHSHSADSVTRQMTARLAATCRGPQSGECCWQLILFSSGSTGSPKVLVRGWRQALSEADAYRERLGLPPGSTAHMLVRPWFGAATKHLLAGLLNGWRQSIGIDNLIRQGPTGATGVLYTTPSQMLQLGAPRARSTRFDWISLTGEACGGALWPLLQSWGKPSGRCLNALGATETGVIAEQVLPLDGPWKPFAGSPAPGKRIDLVDDLGQPEPCQDSVGRIRVCGDALIEGELKEQTPLWHLQPTERLGSSMLVVTGDLARWSAEGLLVLLGRSNHLIKRHGEWIDAAPLQTFLEGLPGVRRCQLLAEDESLTVWIELQSPSRIALMRIVRSLDAGLIDRRLLPRTVHALASFPLNANGKLDLAALRLAAESSKAQEVLSASLADYQTVIASPLDELDSLDRAQLVSQLQRVNVIWYGQGLRVLAAGLPPGVGLIGMPIPEPPPGWSVGSGASLDQVAAAQVRVLREISNDQLGEALWLGGFSLPGWMAYSMAIHLREQGSAVAGVILLDPPDPLSGTFRWGWRRRLSDQWLRHVGARRQWRNGDPWIRQMAWNKELLGRWNPRPLDARLLLFCSRWHRRLRPDDARRYQADLRIVELPCRDHQQILSDQRLIDTWHREIWAQLMAGGLLEGASTSRGAT